MRIATSTTYTNLINQMQSLDTTQNTLETELSTGLSISQPSDNPSLMASTLNLVDESQQQAQYAANANTALQISQATYTSLTQMNSLSNSVNEIALQAASGTESAQEVGNYVAQINQYLQQAVQVGNSQFEGNYLFAGTAVDQPPYQTTTDASGNIISVAYTGNTSQAAIPVGTSSTITPTSGWATNQGLASFMNHLISLRDGLQADDPAQISTAQSGLSAASDTIISAAADSSAVQAAIQSVQSQATSLQQNIGTTIADSTNTNLATTDTQLTEAQTAYQAVLQSSARIMQLSLLNYLTTTSG
jgi:flagellar hook-associated protein 3 FlgL